MQDVNARYLLFTNQRGFKKNVVEQNHCFSMGKKGLQRVHSYVKSKKEIT